MELHRKKFYIITIICFMVIGALLWILPKGEVVGKSVIGTIDPKYVVEYSYNNQVYIEYVDEDDYINYAIGEMYWINLFKLNCY